MSTATYEEPDLITESDGSGVLATLARSEIDQQIATAKRWPRSIKKFKEQALELATLDEETAASMFYVLPRDGKQIEGPSARLAEVVGSAWGNLRYGARVVSVDDSFITAQGVCFDLEKNISASVDVRRRITGKNGRRYSEDMIVMTGNAAASIALRNAIFKIVPFALVKSIYDAAKLTSIGKASSMVVTRSKAMEALKKMGATEPQILAALGKPGVDDIGVEEIIIMRGWYTALKDGDTTLEEALGPAPNGKTRKESDLNQQLQQKPAAEQAPPQKTPEPPPEAQQSPPDDPPAAETEGADDKNWIGDLQEDLANCQTLAQVGEVSGKYAGYDRDVVANLIGKRREELKPKPKGSKPAAGTIPGMDAGGNYS